MTPKELEALLRSGPRTLSEVAPLLLRLVKAAREVSRRRGCSNGCQPYYEQMDKLDKAVKDLEDA